MKNQNHFLATVAFASCLMLTSCTTFQQLAEVKEVAESSYQVNPAGVNATIASVMTFEKLPERYEIIAAKRTKECIEIAINDTEMNVPISILKAPLIDKSKTAASIASEFAKNGVPFETASSNAFIKGGLTDEKNGSIKVGDKEMSYVVGHIQKPYFAKKFVIPAFFGCVAGEKNYLVICAYESDGWMPEAKREELRKDRQQNQSKESTSRIDFEKRIIKDFDLKEFEKFLIHIKSINLQNN